MTAEAKIDDAVLNRLQKTALQVRRDILTMVYRARSGHLGGSLSATEIVVALYHHLMRHDPSNPAWPQRDRFVLSKGHCTPVYYAVLAGCGYFPREELWRFRRPGSPLQGHPHAPKTAGVDASTGTLGLGISTAAGMALAARLRNRGHRVYALCGDGELQEGQVWEAAMFANKHRLGNLTVFVDRNYLQTDGHSERIMPLDPLAPKWEAFGWRAEEIDGHDFRQIIAAAREAEKHPRQPTVILARTVKGKGVPFMENDNTWHGTPPDQEQYLRAMAALDALEGALAG